MVHLAARGLFQPLWSARFPNAEAPDDGQAAIDLDYLRPCCPPCG